jgi:hypothetical protein
MEKKLEDIERPTGPGEETVEYMDAAGHVARETYSIKPDGEVELRERVTLRMTARRMCPALVK